MPSAAAGSASSASIQLWLDFRALRLAQALNTFAFASRDLEEIPTVKEVLAGLVRQLRDKLDKIGVPLPKGQIVEGVLVDKQFAERVVAEVRELGISVYVACPDIDGVKLPGSALFVCDADTQLPVGALPTPPIPYTRSMRPMAVDVCTIIPRDDAEVQAEAEARQAARIRYEEGLKDPTRYVLPPADRMAEILGVSDQDQGSLPVEWGQVRASALPPDPLLWARALMQRRKDAGSKTPVYRLKSDRAAAESPGDSEPAT